MTNHFQLIPSTNAIQIIFMTFYTIDHYNAQKIKYCIKDFSNKYAHLLEKSLMENSTFYVVLIPG